MENKREGLLIVEKTWIKPNRTKLYAESWVWVAITTDPMGYW